MIIKTLVVGFNEANCYILACDKTKEAAIIDPGADVPLVKKAIEEIHAKPRFIINTHGHADHIAANKDLGLPVMIHSLDAGFLNNPFKNMSAFFGFFVTSPAAGHLLKDAEKITLGEMTLEVVHTPGHTPGSICIKTDSVIFTGDTLFKCGVGRTDLAGSSEKDLFNSIKNKLLVLDDNIAVYPGHGPSSTIGEERKNNPFLQ
jgi:glyoxylase-like metal-dependent hydrolase (beta-lactamase superfamily II)